MLKRSDLAKQLDLVIKQEIKNYNDSLNSILQAIRDIREEIKNDREQCLENFALLYSQQQALESQVKIAQGLSATQNHRFDSFMNNQHLINDKCFKELKYLSEIVKKQENNNEELYKKIDSYSADISSLYKRIELNKRLADDNIVDLSKRTKEWIAKAKEEIVSLPCPANEIKNEMENKLNCHVVDVEGVLREIRLAKKEMHIMERKIEHLYTLIGRNESGGKK